MNEREARALGNWTSRRRAGEGRGLDGATRARYGDTKIQLVGAKVAIAHSGRRAVAQKNTCDLFRGDMR
eukprot:158023-Alexandrium_andersonii.AAC.1